MRFAAFSGLVVVLAAGPAPAEPKPAAAGESFAIEKVKVFDGASRSATAAPTTVVVRDGRVVAIGDGVAIPAGAERVDGSGLTLLPGFIDGFSEFGLVAPDERGGAGAGNEGTAQDYGVAAYAETAEASRRGLHPEVTARSLLAKPDKEAQEKLRQAGFTLVLTAPSDGLLPGQACLLELSDSPPRDAVIGEPGVLLLQFRGGGGGSRRGGGHGGGDFGYPSTLMGSLAHLRQAFLDAQRLRRWRDDFQRDPTLPRPPNDSTLDALMSALDGRLRVAFAVDREGDVLRALAFADEFHLAPWIVGGKEAWKCASRLAAGHVPVIASLDFGDAPERKNAKAKKVDAPKSDAKPGDAKPAETAAAAPPVEWEPADPVLAEPLVLFEQRQKEWTDQVKNVERLLAAGVPVALTTRGCKDAGEFFTRLRTAIEHGLDANAAVACLTTTPAALFGVEREFGSVKVGTAADLIAVEGDLASKERTVRHVFVGGRHLATAKKKDEAKEKDKEKEGKEGPREGRGERRSRGAKEDAKDVAPLDLTGVWSLQGGTSQHFDATLTLAQEGAKLTGKLESAMGAADVTSGKLDGDKFELVVLFALQTQKFEFRLKGSATADALKGELSTPFGEPTSFTAARKPKVALPDVNAVTQAAPPAPVTAPAAAAPAAPTWIATDGGRDGDWLTDDLRKPSLHTNGNLFVHDATLLTVSHGTIEHGNVLVKDGRIAALGPDVAAPNDPAIPVLEAAGLFVMPGLVDCHSHAAIEGGVNEGTLSIVPEVKIRDEVDPHDVTIWLALAGGTTTMNLLHGSANVIGGQNAVAKMRYGKSAAEMLLEGAPRGVKFALGENPKQSNFGRFDSPRRYPATRMGVEAALRRAFTRASEYRDEWKHYADAKSRGESLLEPRRDLRLEALVEIMEGRILVHSHCYRADEIVMLMRVAEDFGFRVKTLQHVLEGYKVAPEIAKHGAGPSTFSDWWAYKLEAYDAIPYNAALLELSGCRCSLNSDSADLTRRLYHEAAKTERYGDLDEQRALAQVTLNPAWQLGVDAHIGSLDVGKDADLAVFNGHPLSVYSRCEYTFVDGECYFERKYAKDETRPLNVTGPVWAPVDVPDPSQLPLPSDRGTYALVGGTVHPVSGPPIENGVVVIDRGRVVAVGTDAQVHVPADAEVVKCDGMHVLPGFFDAATSLGLGEIGSVAGAQDSSELGDVGPDLRVTAALNPSSSHVAVARCDGITTALVLPSGGTVAGRGSLVQLRGDTWEQMVVGDSTVLRLQFPSVAADEAPEKALEKDEVTKVSELFAKARRYGEALAAGVPTPRAPGYDALLPFLRSATNPTPRKVVIGASEPNQLRAAALFAEKEQLDALLLGCQEAWLVADFLKQHGAKCLVAGSLGVPRANERYDAAYQNAARLHAAGVPFAICTMAQENVRWLAHHAGMSAAFGLPRDAALAAITLAPAQLLGVADRYGSLEPGKVASVIATDGDPLELRTHVRYEFVGGKPIRLVSKQTELYEQYKKRILDEKATSGRVTAPTAGG
jgi:imidazolonepropionase-like amidohydrolase